MPPLPFSFCVYVCFVCDPLVVFPCSTVAIYGSHCILQCGELQLCVVVCWGQGEVDGWVLGAGGGRRVGGCWGQEEVGGWVGVGSRGRWAGVAC